MQYVYDRFIEGFEEFAQEEYDALQNENTRLKTTIYMVISKKTTRCRWSLYGNKEGRMSKMG